MPLLVAKTGNTRRVVERAIVELERTGYLIRSKLMDRGKPGRRPSAYHVQFPPMGAQSNAPRAAQKEGISAKSDGSMRQNEPEFAPPVAQEARLPEATYATPEFASWCRLPVATVERVVGELARRFGVDRLHRGFNLLAEKRDRGEEIQYPLGLLKKLVESGGTAPASPGTKPIVTPDCWKSGFLSILGRAPANVQHWLRQCVPSKDGDTLVLTAETPFVASQLQGRYMIEVSHIWPGPVRIVDRKAGR